MRMYDPPHPGEVIREYLGDTTVSAAAKHLGVGRVTFSRVLNGKAAVSPEMAVRLAAAFGTSSPEVWLRMQAKYDLWQIRKRNKIRVEPLPHIQHAAQMIAGSR
jgi:antitoxin HigA-1